MEKREVDAKFKALLINEAAHDKELRAVHECILHVGGLAVASEDEIAQMDHAELYAGIAEYYWLNPDEMKLAIDQCEDMIMVEAWDV